VIQMTRRGEHNLGLEQSKVDFSGVGLFISDIQKVSSKLSKGSSACAWDGHENVYELPIWRA
jgi:hypothetical protein